MAMRHIGLTIGLLLLLLSNIGVAAPQAQYSFDDPYHQVIAWELQDSLGKFFNYRLAAREQTQFHYERKDYSESSLMMDTHSLAGLLDWHPFGGAFRASIGLFVSERVINYDVAPAIDWRYKGTTVNFDDELTSYIMDADLTDAERDQLRDELPGDIKIKPLHVKINANHLAGRARAEYRRFAPYWGIGLGNRPFSENRWRYSLDIGMLFIGSPDMEVGLGGKWMSVHPLLTDELNKRLSDEKGELQDKADRYQAIPYFSIGMGYGFN
jgi:hypothetical protein